MKRTRWVVQFVLGLTVGGTAAVIYGAGAQAADSAQNIPLAQITMPPAAASIAANADINAALPAANPSLSSAVSFDVSAEQTVVKENTTLTLTMQTSSSASGRPTISTDKPAALVTLGVTGEAGTPIAAVSSVGTALQVSPSDTLLPAPPHVSEAKAIQMLAQDSKPARSESVKFAGQSLWVQPNVVSHDISFVSDLASIVPTDPAGEKQPTKSKSNGLLGHLTAMLAGIIVPTLFNATASDSNSSDSATLISMLVIGMSIIAMSYGLWLRRSGLATAARSDLPAAACFAASRQLGYVRTISLTHNPFFVVWQNKNVLGLATSGVYRKSTDRKVAL